MGGIQSEASDQVDADRALESVQDVIHFVENRFPSEEVAMNDAGGEKDG